MPRAAALGKDLICRGPVFAEGRTLGKGLFAEGRSLPRAPVAGPRQRVSLPSARDLALGKARVFSSDCTALRLWSTWALCAQGPSYLLSSFAILVTGRPASITNHQFHATTIVQYSTMLEFKEPAYMHWSAAPAIQSATLEAASRPP